MNIATLAVKNLRIYIKICWGYKNLTSAASTNSGKTDLARSRLYESIMSSTTESYESACVLKYLTEL